MLLGINAQVIDKSLREENSPQFRRVFLHNLAMALMDAHLTTRSTIKCLPMDIKCFLKKPAETQDPGRSDEKVTPKKLRGTCQSCGRGKNTSASATCHQCGGFTCKKHATITTLCDDCANKPADSDESF